MSDRAGWYALNEMASVVHITAEYHGWWESERGLPEVLALIHSEVSEALEEYRKGHAPNYTYYREDGKPEGIPSELADVIIRVLDYCHHVGIDITEAVREKHEFNMDRPYMHGKVA